MVFWSGIWWISTNYSTNWFLERAYLNNSLKPTNKTYTTDAIDTSDRENTFKPRKHIEYEGNKYIRLVGDISACKKFCLN